MASPLRSLRSTPRPSASRSTRPELTVVVGRRRFAWFAVFLLVLVGGVLAGTVVLHTQLTARQLEIDRLERAVRAEQDEYDELRAQRAELRSPERLAEYATVLGMTPGTESRYVEVDPWLLAVTIARTGEMPVSEDTAVGENARLRPLDQFRLVKSVSAEAP